MEIAWSIELKLDIYVIWNWLDTFSECQTCGNYSGCGVLLSLLSSVTSIVSW